MATRLERLFQPGTIGTLTIKNRLVMPPMGTGYSEAGRVGRRMIAYYEARARGGVGLIIVEGTGVDVELGKVLPEQPCIDDDSSLPAWAALVRAIHGHGARAALQLLHAGAVGTPLRAGAPALAPSPISAGGREARALTEEDIRDVVSRFARAALRAKQAGFDAVEIHGAHRYLLAQFLSRATNTRADGYGGALPNRARISVEVVEAVRAAVGPEFPVLFRLNGKVFGAGGGRSVEEARQTARMVEQAGADAIHVSGWGVDSPVQVASLPVRRGLLVSAAAAIKRSVQVPVIAVGRISPRMGESILASGKADFIALGRALIADPDLPNKLAAGRADDDINPCIACMECRDDVIAGGALRCGVNPVVGKEEELGLTPAETPKTVLVVGGGPAGLEAARVAALRGHRVELWEKEDRLGGQLLDAVVPAHKARIRPLIRHLAREVEKLGVDVRKGRTATAALIRRTKPDAIVLATGVRPRRPEIPGVSMASVITAGNVLRGTCAVGPRVVVIGGELVGCETAEFLARRGHAVTITRRGHAMALGVNPSMRTLLLARLARMGVRMIAGVTYGAVTSAGLTITTRGGTTELLEADTIVLAVGATGNQDLARALAGSIDEIHLAGDCIEPRNIREAIADGARVGRLV
ncbi:MAG: FAD-dependent oxidoreductase [Gemmatimonadetes bacterium]|nr:FAD-dependent oxidoreductase [Gemmatimonadota bacterium]